MQQVVGRAQTGDQEDWWRDLGRAFGGALIFALPLLMTMEMWYLGFYLGPWQIAQFALLMVPMLAGLSHFAGFRRNQTP